MVGQVDQVAGREVAERSRNGAEVLALPEEAVQERLTTSREPEPTVSEFSFMRVPSSACAGLASAPPAEVGAVDADSGQATMWAVPGGMSSWQPGHT